MFNFLNYVIFCRFLISQFFAATGTILELVKNLIQFSKKIIFIQLWDPPEVSRSQTAVTENRLDMVIESDLTKIDQNRTEVNKNQKSP